ncbi:MAG: hypothetical protein WCL39_02005 [Armatimonadota bacterium]
MGRGKPTVTVIMMQESLPADRVNVERWRRATEMLLKYMPIIKAQGEKK